MGKKKQTPMHPKCAANGGHFSERFALTCEVCGARRTEFPEKARNQDRPGYRADREDDWDDTGMAGY